MSQFRTDTRLILVRHGRTVLNAAGRFRGHEDVPLDALGRAQIEALAGRLKESFAMTQLFTSPLRRALETAAAIADAFGLSTIVEPRLMDLDFGPWQGLTPEEAAAAYPSQYRQWERIPERAILPEGGNLSMHIGATLRLVEEVVADYPGETVGLVTHEVICQGLTCALLGIPVRRFRRITHEPAAFSVFHTSPHGWRVLALNDTCHLNQITDDSPPADNRGQRRASSAAEAS